MSSGSDEPKKGLNGSNGAGSYGLRPVDPEKLEEFEQEEEEGAEPAPEPQAPPLPPPPPAVAELCAACMRFVASKYKVALDGTPDTLSLLDQYVRDARDAARERPESLELVAPAIGAYLGEILRRMSWEQAAATPAEWWAEGDHSAWRLYFTNVYLAFNPIGMAREAITMTEEAGYNAHLVLDPGEREEIEQRLAAIPEVDEEEYYLPSTRLEVVTVVVETLRRHAEATGMADVSFTKEDYA